MAAERRNAFRAEFNITPKWWDGRGGPKSFEMMCARLGRGIDSYLAAEKKQQPPVVSLGGIEAISFGRREVKATIRSQTEEMARTMCVLLAHHLGAAE